jgi:hypothetical protein
MRRLLAALLVGAGLLLAVPAVAGATQDPDIQACLDKAGTEKVIASGPPSCRKDANGEWQPYWEDNFGSAPAGFWALGAVFVVAALVWSAVPVVASYRLAQSTGQSTGMAVVLGLFLGWLGLGVVYLKGRSPMDPAPVRAAAPDRLRTLESLRASGSITEAEYAAQRRAVISDV